VGRCFIPIPLWVAGAYTTAFGMFLLYPILLRISGVVMDCAFSRVMLGIVVAGKG